MRDVENLRRCFENRHRRAEGFPLGFERFIRETEKLLSD
jgi:hypothetical protein